MKNELRKKLTEIKTEMMVCKTKLNDCITAKKDIQENISVFKRKLMLDIADELDTNGKPMFSNQAKRDAEFDIRIATNTNYTHLLNDVDIIEKQITELQMAIENLHYDFRIEEIISRYSE